MLSEALAYPARADEETLLVGAILAVAVGALGQLGPLALLALVPTVLLAGYVSAVLRATAAGETVPPRVADLPTLAADGARALAVAVGYLLVPGVVLAGTLGGAAAGGRPANLGTTLLVFGAGTVVLFVSLGFAYLLPAALAGVARTRRLRTAVESGHLRRTAADGRYFLAWVVAVLVAGITGSAVAALASLGGPGEVLALAAGVYALVAVARLLGRGAAG